MSYTAEQQLLLQEQILKQQTLQHFNMRLVHTSQLPSLTSLKSSLKYLNLTTSLPQTYQTISNLTNMLEQENIIQQLDQLESKLGEVEMEKIQQEIILVRIKQQIQKALDQRNLWKQKLQSIQHELQVREHQIGIIKLKIQIQQERQSPFKALYQLIDQLIKDLQSKYGQNMSHAQIQMIQNLQFNEFNSLTRQQITQLRKQIKQLKQETSLANHQAYMTANALTSLSSITSQLSQCESTHQTLLLQLTSLQSHLSHLQSNLTSIIHQTILQRSQALNQDSYRYVSGYLIATEHLMKEIGRVLMGDVEGNEIARQVSQLRIRAKQLKECQIRQVRQGKYYE